MAISVVELHIRGELTDELADSGIERTKNCQCISEEIRT